MGPMAVNGAHGSHGPMVPMVLGLLRIAYIDLYGFCMDLYGFMLIYMRVNIFIRVFDMLTSLVWPTSVPQALFSAEKRAPGIL